MFVRNKSKCQHKRGLLARIMEGVFAAPVREALLYSCPSLIFPDLLGVSQGALVASPPSEFGSISFQLLLLFGC